MFIKKCECGSKYFNIVEIYNYKADVDEEGYLVCGKTNGGIDSIECAECGQRFSEKCFKDIIF